METRQEQCPAPGNVALETVREWPLWLTEVERWLMPHFARREAQHRAWAYIRGLLSPLSAKTAGSWQKSTAMRPPMVCSICWGGHAGMQTPSVMICVPTLSSPWAIHTRCWSSMKPGFSR